MADLAYADDTLLPSVSQKHLQEYLRAVTPAGRRYGLQLLSGKLQLLNVRCQTQLETADGHPIAACKDMAYLGSILDEDGGIGTERCRRLGVTRNSFRTLASQGLARIQLDLQAKNTYLRKLSGVKAVTWPLGVLFQHFTATQAGWIPSTLSPNYPWVSTRLVVAVVEQRSFRRAGQPKILSAMMLEQQLDQLGKLLRASDADSLRKSAFAVGTTPVVAPYVRRVGRPRKEWAPRIMKEARRRNHAHPDLVSAAADDAYWRKEAVLK